MNEGYDEAPMLPADVRERAELAAAATITDMGNRCNDMVY